MKILLVCFIVMFLLPVPTELFNEKANEPKILVAGFAVKNGRIYVIKIEQIPGEYYWDVSGYRPCHKRVWLEIYVANGANIILYKIVPIKVIPAKPEQWEFNKGELE